MDRGAWWATVHGVTKSQTQLSNLAQHRSLLHLYQMSFFPRERWAMSGDVLGCLTLVERVGVSTGVECVEASNVAKHPIMHRTAPTLQIKNYQEQSVHRTEREKH